MSTQNTPDVKKMIDLDKVIKDQNSKALNMLPRFMVNWLKRIIYQKELNEILYDLRDLKGVDFVHGYYKAMGVTTEVTGLENMPENSRNIYVANHPLGGIDAMVTVKQVIDSYGDIQILANSLLSNVVGLVPIIIPVNVFGKTKKESMKIISETYEKDVAITTLPAGFVSRIIDNEVMDRDWHPSFIKNAKQFKRDIVPMAVNEVNSKLFYRVFKIRKFLRLGANLELFLLPHEMFNKKGKTIKLIIGKPIPYTTFTDKHTNFEWAQIVKKHVHKLKEDANKELDT